MAKLKDLVKVGLVSLIGLGFPSYVNAQTNSNYSNIKTSENKEQLDSMWFNPKYQLAYDIYEKPVHKKYFGFFNQNSLMPDSLNDFSEASLRLKEKPGAPVKILILFGDGDDDGYMDYILMQTNVAPLAIIEQFRINYNKKEIDYDLDFRVLDSSRSKISYQLQVAKQVYYGITQKEAKQIGGIFQKRVTKLIEVTNNFGRFNTQSLDKFLREECSSWQTELEEGKKGAFLISEGFPFERYFSDEQIKKINEVLKNYK